MTKKNLSDTLQKKYWGIEEPAKPMKPKIQMEWMYQTREIIIQKPTNKKGKLKDTPAEKMGIR